MLGSWTGESLTFRGCVKAVKAFSRLAHEVLHCFLRLFLSFTVRGKFIGVAGFSFEGLGASEFNISGFRVWGPGVSSFGFQ